MELEEVFDLVRDDLQKVESELSKNVLSHISLIPNIGKYVLSSGGKRFRPLVLILSAKFCGYTGSYHIPLASIFEFIHTASLLHDDVVDNAEVRRGNSSVNSVWGNEASVLIGDYLFSKSFSLLSNIGDLKIFKVLSDATTRLAEGEIMELEKSGDPSTTEEDYISIVTEKTAVLISAACQVGAILGDAPKEQEKALKGFGLNLGISFQLVDDILDYISTEEEFGKTIGKDLYEGRTTLPLIHTLNVCDHSDREKIINIIRSNNYRNRDLSTIIDLIKRYKGVDYTFKLAESYAETAKEYLKEFNFSIEKQALLATADYAIKRKR
ncbi:MAG: polyprenyl synthetase family protein [Pseudomonadota bacterium]